MQLEHLVFYTHQNGCTKNILWSFQEHSFTTHGANLAPPRDTNMFKQLGKTLSEAQLMAPSVDTDSII